MRQRIRFDYVSKDRLLMQQRFAARAPMLIIADIAGRVALGIWVGALVGFAFLFTPALFRSVASLAQAGAVVAQSLAALTLLGYAAGGVALLCAAVALPGRREFVRIVLVALMLGLSLYTSAAIVPRMKAIAAQSPGPLAALPKDDLRRRAWDAQHSESVTVYGIEVLCGLAALALAGRRRSS